jgi:formate C-acetyltransferase
MKTTRKRFLGGVAAMGTMGWRAFGAPARKQRSYVDTTWWDPYVENITDTDTYLRRKFRQDVTDRSTGLDVPGLKKLLTEIMAAGKASGESWRITKAKCFAAEVEKMSIDVSPLDWFPAITIWDRNDRPIRLVIGKRAGEVNARMLPDWVRKEWQAGNKDGSWNMWQDFDHSVPDWRVIMALGYPGMKKRLEKYAVAGDPFYEGLKIAMAAILAGIDRFIEQGKKHLGARAAKRLEKEIACLERLRNGPPQTAYDMMMFVWIYFFFSEHLDGIQCRSLTELDVFLTPYYDADIAAGRTTEAEFREQLKHFLWQWGSVNNYWNQPAGFGGTKKDGTSAFNHVSKIILDVMDECALTTPKFLVKVAPNTPDWAWDKMLDLARRHRSIAFIGEEPAAKALKKWCGASDEACRTMVMRGCYEFDLADSCNRTGCGYMNMLKPVEEILAEACRGSVAQERDPPGSATGGTRSCASDWICDFPSFKAEYLRRLAARTARCREIAFEFEKVLSDVNPACCMTLSTEHALRTRRDAFANGCPHGNNTAILSAGFGTAVDALLAVKEIVFEKKEMSLAELGKVMSENWKGHEALRLRMLRSKRKWGNNDPEANALGAEIAETYAKELNGKPNSRGGVFLASGHSARQFIYLGAKTGATPDGRKKGEEISKNMSPTMGVDTEGATALVATLAASDVTRYPGDYPLDMMLHPSVCHGEKGLKVMRSLVEIFHKNGGSVIQFTVFSAEELRDAQAHPEKYENLQVRVCGWNVRWNDMSKSEQDAYIRRAENMMKEW